MGANFTTSALAQDVAEIGARVQCLFSLAECDLSEVDARAVAADIVSITKELGLVRAQIHAVIAILRRSAMLLLTLQDLAAATGKSADLDAFFSACSAEALDYMVALRKAGREEAGAFYLECYAKASTYKTNPWRVGAYMGSPDGKIGTYSLMWEDPESLVWTFEPKGEITENGFTREEHGAMVERRALCGLDLEDKSDGSGIRVVGGWRFDETGAAVAYPQAQSCSNRAQALGLGIPAGLLDRYEAEGHTYAFGFGMEAGGPGPFGLGDWLINHKDSLFRCRQ